MDCPDFPACQVAKHPHPSTDAALPWDPERAQPAWAHHAKERDDADGRLNGWDADGSTGSQRDEHGAEAAAWTSHTARWSRVGEPLVIVIFFQNFPLLLFTWACTALTDVPVKKEGCTPIDQVPQFQS